MDIKYKNRRLEEALDNYDTLSKNISMQIAERYKEFLYEVTIYENLYEWQKNCRGRNVEKLKGREGVWSARFNQKYRVEFICQDVNIIEVIEITIIDLHGHKY